MKTSPGLALTLLASLAILPAAAHASEAANGSFTATKSCEAFNSFAKRTNPGDVRTAPNTAYQVREINRPGDYQWVRVEVPGATPPLRWVARDCGTPALGTPAANAPDVVGNATPVPGSKRDLCSTPNVQDSYVLAVTWQPGFCEHTPNVGGKPECSAMEKGSLTVSNLTLHGLWPNKQGCGTSYGNCEGKPFELKKETVARIAPWMPNFYFENSFGKYEWNKHGTCQALDPDAYFTRAVAAVQLVNASAIGQQVIGNIGGSIKTDKFFEMLRGQYGDGVASRVMLVCTGKSYLQEIRVQLPLDFSVDKGLAGLTGTTPGQGPQTSRCGSEIFIEASGRQ